MSVPRRGPAQSYNKNQPQQQPKKAQTKPVKQQWAAQDYANAAISVEEVRQIKTAFDIFDSDGSGLVDPVQLKNAFVSLGFAASNKFVFNILNELDTQNQGGLTFEAFIKLATGRLGESHSKEDVYNVFKSFDLEKRGKITAQEFKMVAEELGQNLTDDEIDKIFQKTDLDEDGYITAEDFYTVMSERAAME